MGFFSGMGRGFRGMLDGAAGTQALLAGDHGAYGRMRAQQARLRAAQAKMAEAGQPGLADSLAMQGVDPALFELALANPEFAQNFLPFRTMASPFGAGDGNEARSTPLVEHEDTHGIMSGAVPGGGPPTRRDVLQLPRPGHEFHDPAPFVGQDLGGDADEEDPGAGFDNLSMQDGFARSLEIRAAQERAHETGRDYRDILRELRGLPPRRQAPGAVATPARPVRKPPTSASTARPAAPANNPAPWRPGGRWNRPQVEQEAANAMRMYKIHIDRGMSPEQAAGWAANAQAESHGKYTSTQHPNGPGRGLFQWGHPNPGMDRRLIFQRQFGYPIEKSSEEDQLAFRDWELANTLRGAARRISRASTAGDVAEAITRYYERPASLDRESADRANIAEAILRRSQQP